MTITKRDIDNFNRGVMPSANEEYNKANKIYNREVYLKLRAVKSAKWGMLKKSITMSHVNEWINYV
jgi:hypothetical protein